MAIFRRDRGPKGPNSAQFKPKSDHFPKGSRAPRPVEPNGMAKGPKRSLSHVGGQIETEGNPEEAKKLAFALDVKASTERLDDPTRAHVHGFHSYPARMHPITAHRLAAAFGPKGGKILDPFCGSGTVLVEAMLLGMKPTGLDINPLAVRLSKLKTTPLTNNELDHLVDTAHQVADFAHARRKGKAGASRRYGFEDVSLFEPHVLLELDSLAMGIFELGKDHARSDLELVLSSILTRMSRQRGDTSDGIAPRRLAAGFATKQFAGKAEELAKRLAVFRQLLPSAAQPAASLRQGNATKSSKLPGAPFDALITSPPYAATYDYIDQHSTRFRWLGLDSKEMQKHEMGARAKYADLHVITAEREWMGELRSFFSSMGTHLKPGAPLILLIADSAVATEALRASELVAKAGRACGFKPVARASQARPHFHGPTAIAFRDRPRMEHALLLRKE